RAERANRTALAFVVDRRGPKTRVDDHVVEVRSDEPQVEIAAALEREVESRLVIPTSRQEPGQVHRARIDGRDVAAYTFSHDSIASRPSAREARLDERLVAGALRDRVGQVDLEPVGREADAIEREHRAERLRVGRFGL